MNSRTLQQGLILAAALLSAGCNAVYSPTPLGEKACALNAAEWEGVWAYADGALTVQSLDPADGRLRVSWVEKDGDKAKLESHEVQVRSIGEWMFVNLPSDEDPNLYSWARIKKDQHEIVGWGPDVPKFKKLIESKKLPGTVKDNGDIVLGRLTPEQLKLIASEKEGVLLNWENPVVARRIAQ